MKYFLLGILTIILFCTINENLYHIDLDSYVIGVLFLGGINFTLKMFK